jgi:type VI secretion system protein ImpK
VGLRRQLLARVEEFEVEARAGGVPRPKIVAARYLLCTFIDEAVAATPWGASDAWSERTLLQEFHDEPWGGEKAFKLLERMGEDIAANADVLELFYVCLALGFEGRYRGKPNGRAQLDAIATRLVHAVRPTISQQTSRTLSLRWTGVAIRDRALSVVPLWAVYVFGAVIVVAAMLAFNARLEAQSRPLFRQVLAIPNTLRSDLLDRSTATRPRLAPLLRADIAAGAIQVRDEALRSTVTVPADALFVSGSAEIDAQRFDLLARIAAALAGQPGQIVVIGHTDDQPANSVQFPSNWHLSQERAGAVSRVLARARARDERVRAEGRAEAEPLASNDTSSGRARNRRIEIVLLLPRPEG